MLRVRHQRLAKGIREMPKGKGTYGTKVGRPPKKPSGKKKYR